VGGAAACDLVWLLPSCGSALLAAALAAVIMLLGKLGVVGKLDKMRAGVLMTACSLTTGATHSVHIPCSGPRVVG
jgi:hypothetical protein